MIRCNDGSLYTGISSNIERRFFEHQHDKSKKAKYLRGKDPLSLVWQEVTSNKSEALILEAKIKKLSKQKKRKVDHQRD
ncbi:GIY-YIG nuclease family protein [Candidatus Auribacterota bacterium]